ncbi:polymorphic toxin-type HINT domain-containing protein [Nonomuraea jabiensis]|uniref:polymorphic toxin-type HINT domain-containing protein n=1 Tax=Nonomuraea jabiensis TaxID=882448 RepID=UPI003D74AA51
MLARITGEGAKNLVRVSVRTEDGSGVVIATAEHPFWVEDLKAWVGATRLSPGTWLKPGAGTHVQVAAVAMWTSAEQDVYNVTVAGPHTYHVAAASTDIKPVVRTLGGDEAGVQEMGLKDTGCPELARREGGDSGSRAQMDGGFGGNAIQISSKIIVPLRS